MKEMMLFDKENEMNRKESYFEEIKVKKNMNEKTKEENISII
jgi:hypothetical protein